jgi:hypothetical protein
MTIEIPDSYVTEKLNDGFSLYAGGRMAPAVFAKACVELGHRLATEGKDIVSVDVIEHRCFERVQDEISVRVKIRHRLRKSQAEGGA